jgi:hypothetical protein
LGLSGRAKEEGRNHQENSIRKMAENFFTSGNNFILLFDSNNSHCIQGPRLAGYSLRDNNPLLSQLHAYAFAARYDRPQKCKYTKKSKIESRGLGKELLSQTP